MKKTKFLFGIHCHQPVGNFEQVIEAAYQQSYLPFMEVMARHPKIRFAVHYSGILYDWLLEKHPEFIALLKKLIRRGQVEVLTAGYYEPILPIIPDEDKLGQIKMSNQFIADKFGVMPRGLWLTERIWEPALPKILTAAGIDYVTVDDYHFISAGLSPDKLLGYYITEDQGSALKIFPINKTLRYLIPFRLPEETIDYLRSLAAQPKPSAAVLFDDGEKFGVWPGTHKWVFNDGYLENLLTKFEENSSWLSFLTFSEFIDEYPALGRIYLPTASYFEMMEWSLLTEAGKKMAKITAELKQANKFDEYSQFFKGGFFRNFFVKYPEANNMHKKMLQVSAKLKTQRSGKSLLGQLNQDSRFDKALVELYQGQCNCAYWHGIFGGLYLNYLRHAIYEHLIKAEVEIEKANRAKSNFVELNVCDLNTDGHDEVVLSNQLLNLYFAPAYGGALFELDYKPKAFNLINTLARREEVYHSKISASAVPEEAGVANIHGALKVKEKGLADNLVYDWHQRYSLLDHFLSHDTDLEKFSSVQYREVGNFTIEPYAFMPKKTASSVSVALVRDGEVEKIPVRVEKTVTILAKQSIIEIEYRVTNLGREKDEFWFGVEFNFSLLAGNAPDRYFQIPGVELADKSLRSKGETANVFNLKVVDEWSGFALLFDSEKSAQLWRFPIETVSQSEAGLEKTYQSSVLFPNWKFVLAPGQVWSNRLTLRIEE